MSRSEEPIVFPVPPLNHQEEFSERAEEVFSLVALADTATQSAERLAQSLMSQAFATNNNMG